MQTTLKLIVIAALLAGNLLADDRPNFIFLLTDDQRVDSLGCYGNDFIQTPNIDRLAEEGVLFNRAYVTSAICTPSRASYFLGQYERRHGVNFNSGTALTEEAWAQSYPVLLRQAGYFTGYIGKNHVPIGDQGYMTGIIERSFDFWYAAHRHLTFYPKERHPIFEKARADTQVEILQEGALSFVDPRSGFIEGAEAFLRQRPGGRPFCLSICFNLPHGAGTSSMKLRPQDPELYRTTYRDGINDFPLPPHYTPRAKIQIPRLPPDILFAEHRQKSYDYVDTEEDLRERMVREFQTITGIDQMVGVLRQKLQELGLDQNTVIVFASDHGIMHGEFGLGGKALNYEPCLRIPMIIHDPRMPERIRGLRAEQLVMSIDIAPTLLQLAGLRPPRSMQGRSLVPILRDEVVLWRDYTFAENLWSTFFGNPRCESVTSSRWKYIRYFANDRSIFDDDPYKVTPERAALYAKWLNSSIAGEQPVHEELFDLLFDPNESQNLALQPSHRSVLERMRAECHRLVREARGDPATPPATVPIVAPESK